MPEASAQQYGNIYIGERLLSVKRAAINASSNGNNTLVAAVPARKLVVLNILIMSAGTVTLIFQSGAGGTALSGGLPLTAQKGFCPGYDPTGHFETAAGELLNLNLSAGVACTGYLNYVEV